MTKYQNEYAYAIENPGLREAISHYDDARAEMRRLDKQLADTNWPLERKLIVIRLEAAEKIAGVWAAELQKELEILNAYAKKKEDEK